MAKLQLRGIIPPIVTPLLSDDKLDKEGTVRLTEHLLSGGVHGIFVLGTTGEAQSLPYAIREEIIELVCKVVAGRVPVLAGITDSSFSESVKLAHHAKKCGATALVAAAPYYFPANQDELVKYYTALADAVPLPLYLYNMPSKVKVFLNVPTVLTLSKHPNIHGIKDSSCNAGYMANLLYYFKDTDFDVFVGPEEVTGECVMMGASGGVNGGANLFPKLFVDNYIAAVAGDIRGLKECQKKIMKLSTTLYGLMSASDASFLKSIKCSLGLKGICSDYTAWPYRSCTPEEKAKVSVALDQLKGYE